MVISLYKIYYTCPCHCQNGQLPRALGPCAQGGPALAALLKIKEKGGKEKKMKEKKQRNQEQIIVNLIEGHGGPAP